MDYIINKIYQFYNNFKKEIFIIMTGWVNGLQLSND